MYGVRFVGDDALPEGHDFLYVDFPDGGLVFLRRGAVCPKTLEDAWTAYRAVLRSRRRDQAQLRQLA